MSEYVKKVEILEKAVEVEYLGRPRLMVSVAQIGLIPALDITRCKNCKHRRNKSHGNWCSKLYEWVSEDFFCGFAVYTEQPIKGSSEYRKQYNARYYQTVTKPKREREKRERENERSNSENEN